MPVIPNKVQHTKPSRRRFGSHVRPALAKYTSLIGEVTLASNHLHGELLHFFETLFPSEDGERHIFSANHEMAAELWHSLRSDDAQRAALRAIAKHSRLLKERHRKSLLWVIDAAGKLSEFRNDAIHAVFDLDWEDGWGARQIKFSPTTASHPKRFEKLERVGHVKLFRTAIGDLHELGDYATALWINLLPWENDGPPPLPKRPLLQSVLLVQKSPPETNTPARRPQSPKRQQKSSRGSRGKKPK